MTDDLREFRHDYKNHMICLQSLLNNKQYDEALSYVKSITNQEILDSNKFFSVNQIADAILTDKNELAQKITVRLYLTVLFQMKYLFPTFVPFYLTH